MKSLSLGLALGIALSLSACRSVPTSAGTDPTPSANGPKKAEGTSMGATTEGATTAVGIDPGHIRAGGALTPTGTDQLAVFAAGCFWGVESTFRAVPGVVATAVGYTGGHTKNPTYEEVCKHTTGHAEAVLVEFDPAKVSYAKLLDVFLKSHDPTTIDQQGPDVGDQYRSAVFTLDAAQDAAARAAIANAQPKISEKIVTKISPLGTFTLAEEYHQQWHEKTGSHGCPTGKSPLEGT